MAVKNDSKNTVVSSFAYKIDGSISAKAVKPTYSFMGKDDKDVYKRQRNDRVGKKILITGKGRCNVTNNSDLQNLIAHVPKNGKFLYSAFSQFSAEDADVYKRQVCN